MDRENVDTDVIQAVTQVDPQDWFGINLFVPGVT
jgi:hypothetical protein